MSKGPELSPGKAALRAARKERLAQALRENLKRRRERAAAAAGAAEEAADYYTALSGAAPSSKSGARGRRFSG